MTNNHRITPSPELKQQWFYKAPYQDYCSATNYVIDKAAQWGYEQCDAANEAELQKARDEELEACCEWLSITMKWNATAEALYAARRLKPPSLKEQALEALNEADQGLNESEWRPRSNTIRRALEQLPDDQG